jgi:hypothetical protein
MGDCKYNGGRSCKYAIHAVMRRALPKVISVDRDLGATGPAGSPVSEEPSSRRAPPQRQIPITPITSP